MDQKSEIRSFIEKNYLFSSEGTLLDSDSLLQKGIVDSTGILELISFLEEKFGIAINDDELLPANLDSIENIVNFLEKKRLSST
jgi:acyl carrier protein